MKKLYFSAVLAATLILGGVLAYTIWKASPRNAQTYFESGKKYFDQQKYPEATIQLMNAIRKDARHREARYVLALAYMKQQDLSRAAAELKYLLEYYPDDIQANLELGGILLSAGQSSPEFFRQAQEIAGRVLAKDPRNIGALLLSGNASTGLRDYRASVDFYERALNLDPQNFSAFVSLGTSQTLQKNYAEAEQSFLKAREINPRDKSVLISLGNYYRAIQQSDKAEAVFKDALSIFPEDRQVYLQLVDFYTKTGRFPEAEQVLRDAQARISQNPEPSLILVDLYDSRDRHDDARKALLDLKEKFPKNVDVAVKVALSFLQDQPQQARIEIDQIIKTDPKNPMGYVLLGESQFMAGQYDAAQATLEKPATVDSPYPQIHFFLGNIEMRKGQLDQALFHYQKSLAVDGTYVPSRVAMAEALLGKGRVDDSREEVRKALAVRSDYVPARILKATLDGADKNNKEAEAELTALVKEQPENATAFRQMGLYYESRGQIADAEKNLARALELRPDSPELLRDLVLFYVRQKQLDRAIQRINATPDEKKQALHYELLGLVHSQAGRTQDAENAYKKAQEKDPTRKTVDKFLFAEYIKSGRLDAGLQKIDDIIKKDPSTGDAYVMKGQIYESQGKIEEAKQSYAQALKLNANSGFAANNLAYILAEQGSDLNGALGYAQTARKQLPENPDAADTLGWVYYKLGNYVLAREQIRFALTKQPENGSYQYHMGMILKQMKLGADAQAALKKAADNPKEFKEKNLAQSALRELASLK